MAWQALLAGATFATSGTMLADLLAPKTAGAIGLIVGALQVSTITYASLTGARLPAPAAAYDEPTYQRGR